ncbi:MAG: hypothetical protein P8Y91_08100 [Desulfuromonadales bacterium]
MSVLTLRALLILLLVMVCIQPVTTLAFELDDLLGKQELDETERQEAIERMQVIQEKLKLLQEKLKALERRKAGRETTATGQAATAESAQAGGQINWLPVDETATDPGAFGLYTYLLFSGSVTDTAAIGSLEDFILTIETLPASDRPPALSNRFLVPVETAQSIVALARRPYDFKLNAAYLRRLDLTGDLPLGPILISTAEPVDPFGNTELPPFLAVSFGQQSPERAHELARLWHRQEVGTVKSAPGPVKTLFWQVIDGTGPVRVEHQHQRILVTLP